MKMMKYMFFCVSTWETIFAFAVRALCSQCKDAYKALAQPLCFTLFVFFYKGFLASQNIVQC